MERYSSILGECTESLQMKVDCVHHWEIEPSNGPLSRGVCKRCKSMRDFQNSIYVEKQQSTLEKDTSDDEKEGWRSWNQY